MEGAYSSKTMVMIYQTTEHHIKGDNTVTAMRTSNITTAHMLNNISIFFTIYTLLDKPFYKQ
jgi:glycine cleavage system pyridoxal-binding protein P